MRKLLLFLLLTLFSLALAPASPGQALGPWSEPLLLNDEGATTPFILADSSGAVHVFWGSTGLTGTKSAIFYRRLADGVWSETVDILAPPAGSSAIYPSAAIDEVGTIHLVWVSDKLYYSQAHLSQALEPRAWSTPYQMTNYAVSNAVIRLGLDGSLNVLFGSRGSTPAVYLLKSEDGGDFWRVAVQVSMPQGGAYALTCSLAVDAAGRLHAAWAEALPKATQGEGAAEIPPSGVYYARSDDGGAHWSYPRAIAGADQGDPAIGVDAQDRLHIFWSGTGSAAGKYHLYWDPQFGEWSRIERILPSGEGLLGPPALALDASGWLHIAIAAAGQPAPGEIITLSWRAGRWGDAYQPAQSLADAEVEHAQPALAIALGNSLHLVWIAIDLRDVQQDDSPGYLWYASRQLASSPIEALPVPTRVVPPATPTPLVQPTVVLPTPTPWVVVASGFLPQTPVWYKVVPIVTGASLTVLVLIVLLRISFRKRTHVR